MMSTFDDQALDRFSVICEAVGCLEKATTKIAVKVGEEEIITLILCKECVKKFED